MNKQWILAPLCFIAPISYGLPLLITAEGNLPTEVLTSGNKSAFYKVQNNTNQTLNDVHVTYLPPNVNQATDYSDYCGRYTNLNPRGTAGDSCILHLSVTGAVDANDPDPHHHLFMCLPDDISCAGTKDSLNVTVINKYPLISAGGLYPYNINFSLIAPLVAQSNNNGDSWSFGIDTNVLSSWNDYVSTAGELNAIFVSNQQAVGIAAGAYGSSQNNDQAPFLFATTNVGDTWQRKIDLNSNNLPSDFNAGIFSAATCANDLFCVALGVYNPPLTVKNKIVSYNNLLTMVSRDGTNTWTYENISNVPHGISDITLKSVSCNELTQCAAVGYYASSQTGETPFILLSQKNGINWTYNYVPTPSDMGSTAELNSVAYSNDGQIVAAGTYQDPHSTNYGYAIRSSDFGKSFSVVIASKDFPNATSVRINNVCCDQNNCTAVGKISGNNGVSGLLVLSSADGGKNWQHRIDQNSQFPLNYVEGDLTSVACKGRNAMAAGYYAYYNGEAKVQYPILAVTHNGWQSFDFVVEKDKNLPTSLDSGLFTSVSIGNNVALIAGQETTAGTNTYPLLAVSYNLGNSWTYKIYDGSTLPSEYSDQGLFLSANANSSYGTNTISIQPAQRVLETLAPQFPLLPTRL